MRAWWWPLLFVLAVLVAGLVGNACDRVQASRSAVVIESADTLRAHITMGLWRANGGGSNAYWSTAGGASFLGTENDNQLGLYFSWPRATTGTETNARVDIVCNFTSATEATDTLIVQHKMMTLRTDDFYSYSVGNNVIDTLVVGATTSQRLQKYSIHPDISTFWATTPEYHCWFWIQRLDDSADEHWVLLHAQAVVW